MPNINPSSSPSPVLPPFQVQDGWIVSHDGYSAAIDAEMAIRVLADYVDDRDETTDGPISEEHRVGLGYLMRLVCNDIRGRLFENARLLNSRNVQRLLDEEAQARGHDDEQQ